MIPQHTDDYHLCREEHLDSNPGMTILVSVLICAVFGGIVGCTIYCAGVREGRKQMTAEYSAEIRRLNVASRPEVVRDWLRGGKP